MKQKENNFDTLPSFFLWWHVMTNSRALQLFREDLSHFGQEKEDHIKNHLLKMTLA